MSKSLTTRLIQRLAAVPRPTVVDALVRSLVLRFVPKHFRRGGIDYVMNPRDYIVTGRHFLGIYETFERQLFVDLLEAGTTVVDVGANVGIFTAAAARVVGPAGLVIAVEPEPSNLSCLRAMVEANGFRNVRIEAKAMADYTGTHQLFLSADNMGDHRLHAADENRQHIEVPTMRLDDLLGSTIPQVIKMDIQGAEALAVRGMERTLASMSEGSVLLEFWPYGMRRAGSDPLEPLDALTRSGFVGWEMRSIEGGLAPIDRSRLLAMRAFSQSTNLVFVKGQRYEQRASCWRKPPLPSPGAVAKP